MESELSGLSEEERGEFLSTLGVTDEDCGLKVRAMIALFETSLCV